MLQSSIFWKPLILSLTADVWVNFSISMATCYFGYKCFFVTGHGISGWSQVQGGSSSIRSAAQGYCRCRLIADPVNSVLQTRMRSRIFGQTNADWKFAVFALYQRQAEPCAHWDSLSALCWWYPVIPSSRDDIWSDSGIVIFSVWDRWK